MATAFATKFFEYIFDGADDSSPTKYVCIATARVSTQYFKQRFFEWPEAKDRIAAYVAIHSKDKDVYFCISLLDQEERKKEHCLGGSLIWADFDEVPNVDEIEPKPSCLVESSPGKYQAYWRVNQNLPADVREDFARRVTYANKGDIGTWDMTRLLRVPYTRNHKYESKPDVSVLWAHETLVPVELFAGLPEPTPSTGVNGSDLNGSQVTDMPDIGELPDVNNIIYAYRNEIRRVEDFTQLFSIEPHSNADWSRIMWRLIKVCFEAGMSKEEVFAVALQAKCNKYERDNRPISYLWREVVKASLEETEFYVGIPEAQLTMPQLVDPDTIEEDSLVRSYKDWADKATDAPTQYHELSCFIALSSLISGGLYLPVEFGELVPNLWGLVLGESTLTRKTTAMRMAMDIISDLEEEVILASDGSVEGLLTGLSHRPNRVSIFYKDEVSGFLDAINRKDYLAGMAETLTLLYDVPKVLPRLLKKETITIHSPYFIFFGGGIRDKVYSNLNEEYVLSGFIPRFLIVSGENDLQRLRRTGPPSDLGTSLKQVVLNRMIEIKEQFNLKAPIEVAGQQMLRPIRYQAKLSDEAWEFFGDTEELLIKTASESPASMVALPTFQRLAFSALKMAMLIAATRREPNNDTRILLVEKNDLEQAAWYIQSWGKHSVDLILNVGKPHVEKLLEKLVQYIRVNQGVPKSTVMNRFHLNARETRDLLETLQDRGIIVAKKANRGLRLYTVTP